MTHSLLTVLNFHPSSFLIISQAYYNLYFFSHFDNQETKPHPCAYRQGGGGGGGGVNSDPQNYDRLGSLSPDRTSDAKTSA